MASAIAVVLRYVRNFVTSQECAEGSDRQLLQQFIARRDEHAFAALLQRHDPLVLGACRQVLRDTHDAEDAFQATFLVLARKAASICKHESLAAWLYRVALNISRTAKSGTAQRRTHERRVVLMSETSSPDEGDLRDWQPLIHEEVDRLPEKYRVPVVLCYFKGKTHHEAARELAWPLGTVKGRLARARNLLRTRLGRRGLALSAAGVAAALTQSAAWGQVPAVLFSHTVKAAVCFARGASIPAGAVSEHALTLAKEALPVITTTKLAALAVLMMSAALLVTYSLVAGTPPDRQEGRPLDPHRLDLPGANAQAEPLPAGVVARMGTPRFRHGGPVLSMAYLSGGKVLATGGYIGTRRETRIGRIRLWDTATGKELRQFQLKGTAHVAASPDGKTLAGADESEGVIYLWDAATGKEIRRLKSSRSGFGGILPVAFSPDGRRLVAGGHELRMWDVESGKLLHSLDGEESVIQLSFSAESKILAVRYCDLIPMRLFQIDPWKELAPLRPKWDMELLVFSPDRKTLAVTAKASGSIYLYDVVAGTEQREIRAHQVLDPDGVGHQRVTALAFSPEGKTLASAASDKTIRLWAVATGKERQRFPADSYGLGALAFAPDGKALAWANSAGLIRIWDLQTGRASHGHDGHSGVVTSVALTPDSKTLITAGADATIRFWETGTGKELRRFEGHQGPIASVHLSPDGKTLASVSPADKTVRVWDLSTGKEVRLFRASSTYCDAAWLPDNRTLVIRRYDDPAVYFCAVATGEETRKIEKTWSNIGMSYPANVEGAYHGGVLAVSPDGKMLVTSVNYCGGTFHLWDTATGKELPGMWPDPHNQVVVMTAVFSPDSKTLVTGTSSPTTIHVWDIATRKARQQFASHLTLKDASGEEYEVPTYLAITYLALSPDGRTLATASRDHSIRLWDVDTGTERRRLEGHRGTVTSLAWSADSKRLASGSNDGTALVWDVVN